MENNVKNNNGKFSDDNSIYRYLLLEKNDEKYNEKDVGEEWDDYSLDDYKLDWTNIADEIKSEKALNTNLQSDSLVPELSTEEQRLNIIFQLQELHMEHRELKLKNSFLHKKCRDIFIKLKIMNYLERWSYDMDIHKDKRYIDILKEFKATKILKENTENYYEKELKSYEDLCQHKFSEFRDAFQKLTARQLEIGTASVNSRINKNAAATIIDLLNKQKHRLNILSRVRVKYLKLENLLKNVYSKLDNRNILGEGYTIIKYEILLMNKNMLMEKVDEREKDLEKFRDKFFSIVHMLAHMREVSIGVTAKIEKALINIKNSEDFRREKRVELVKKNKRKELLHKKIIEIKYSMQKPNV